MPWLTLLYAIIFVTGYGVASATILSLRTLTGYSGNGPDVVSIVATVVLLAFAAGSYRGGMLSLHASSIRHRLGRIFIWAILFLGGGLSVLSVDGIFMGLGALAPFSRLFKTVLYALLVIAPPVYLLGQVMPLVSCFLHHRPAAMGRILFWAAFGACLGALLPTWIFMPYLGLHIALLVMVVLFLLAVALLQRQLTFRSMAVPLVLALLCVALNSGAVFQSLGIYYQNAYNTARIISKNGDKLLSLNNTPRAGLQENGARIDYIEKAEHILLAPTGEEKTGKRILVLGASGFTFGLNDTTNSFTYVDPDPDLQRLAEDHFLKEKLGPNKTVVTSDIRAYLIDAIARHEQFDLVYIDLYDRDMLPADEMITNGFFKQVWDVLKPDGIAGANFMVGPGFGDPFSVRLDATFHAVFPAMMRLPVRDLNPWEVRPGYLQNFLYLGYKAPDDTTIYTDDKNPAFIDKPNN